MGIIWLSGNVQVTAFCTCLSIANMWLPGFTNALRFHDTGAIKWHKFPKCGVFLHVQPYPCSPNQMPTQPWKLPLWLKQQHITVPRIGLVLSAPSLGPAQFIMTLYPVSAKFAQQETDWADIPCERSQRKLCFKMMHLNSTEVYDKGTPPLEGSVI